MQEQLFPSKIASGKAFCNREEERGLLVKNISKIKHTLIISPRRYGKTSLALQAISEAKVSYAYVNLFNALKDESVAKRFTKSLSDLVTKMTPAPQKALKKLTQIVTKAKITLEFMDMKTSFNLQPTSQDPLEIIIDLLENIENILAASQKNAVIFLDEFQDIAKTEMNDELQAELRDFAQRTQHVTFIISGSHRNMLNKIFDDRNKPFYKLCDRINLERIKTKDHTAFIQKHAKAKWGNTLSEKCLQEIIRLTENHPYYINRLCNKLWDNTAIPKENEISIVWQAISEEEYDSIVNDLSLLTKNQRIVLQAIAQKGYLKEHTSQAVTQELKMAHSSIKESLSALLKTDFIELTDNGYRIIDPMIKYVLSTIGP